MHLLLIEDNPDLVANLADFLEGRGHTLDIAYNGYAGLGFALENAYDAAILDLMLPGMDGFEVCERLRASGHGLPVLMLTARDGIEDKLEGFASGADDYLVKPFSLRELEARLTALVRRVGGAASGAPPGARGARAERLTVADLELDLATRRLTRAGRPIELPPIPMRLLEALMRRAPALVGRAELERAAWGDDPPDSDALRAHLHLLRQAIDKPFSSPLLHTVRGFGYRLGARQIGAAEAGARAGRAGPPDGTGDGRKDPRT